MGDFKLSYIIYYDVISPSIEDVWGAVGFIYKAELGTMYICIRVGIVSGDWINNVVKGANTISSIENSGVNVLALTEVIIRRLSLDYIMISSRKVVHSSGLGKRT